MRTVAVYNNKGGVGKTTIAAHLVYRADAKGIRTLAVAMDRQGDLPKWLSGGDQGHRDGAVFDFSKNVTVLYSPDAAPEGIRGVDLVIVDTPAAIEIASRVKPDLWVAPCDGRMALEDLANVLPTMLEPPGARVLIVFNRADAGGTRTLSAMQRAAAKIPGLSVWTEAIPDSAAVKRAGEFYMPAWDVPYGASTSGARILRAVIDSVLDSMGLADGNVRRARRA
ncbi:MAG: ParA family protein [Pseudomonadota bacterium]|nr:ParA family protein [Pseudomonadota bacterium]